MGVSVALTTNLPNFIKGVLNLIKVVPNFANDVPRVSKCVISCPTGVCPVDWCSINWCTLILDLKRE